MNQKEINKEILLILNDISDYLDIGVMTQCRIKQNIRLLERKLEEIE